MRPIATQLTPPHRRPPRRRSPRLLPPALTPQGYCGWCPYLNKWVTFTASIGVALTCGLTYTFSIWSGCLKEAYSLRQDQLEIVASAANFGGYFAVLSGIAYDALENHKKFGKAAARAAWL